MSDKIYLKGAFGFREDTLENWLAVNPILERGEPSVVRDGKDSEWLKIGDGVTPWVDLPWKKGPKGECGPKGEGVGFDTEVGGTIFNDYENNKAGLKGFNIQASGVTQTDIDVAIPLDSVEGIEVGDVVSVQISNNYDYIGSVSSIDAVNTSVIVTLLDPITLPTNSAGTLWLPYKPYIGTTVLGEYAFAANINTTAAAKGTASFGEANVAGGKRSFCGGGEENFAGYAGFVAGQGNKIRGLRCAGFGFNNEIATPAQYAFVANTNNKVRSNGTAVFGGSNTDGYGGGGNFITGVNNIIKDNSPGRIFVTGNGNTVSGQTIIVGGTLNFISGNLHTVFGSTNNVEGVRHIVVGHDNIVSGESNSVMGSTSKVAGDHNFTAGWQHNVGGQYQAYFGFLSEQDDDAIIVAGNGYFKDNVGYIRQNAFKVMKDGSARIQTASTEDDAVVRYSQIKPLLEKIAQLEHEISALKGGEV